MINTRTEGVDRLSDCDSYDNISLEIIPDQTATVQKRNDKEKKGIKNERKEAFERARAWHLDRKRDKKNKNIIWPIVCPKKKEVKGL